jgi:hypothetical protein
MSRMTNVAQTMVVFLPRTQFWKALLGV